jgi:hypothetical protein
MLDHRKALYDYHPTELTHEQLNAVYSALVAKLKLICEELIGRQEKFGALAKQQLETDAGRTMSEAARRRHEETIEEYSSIARQIRALHDALTGELSRLKGHHVESPSAAK